MTHRAAPGEIPRALHRTWWLPLAFVALTIVALTATPVIVSMRVQRLRTALSDGTNAARVIVNDLEVAVATQALALQSHDAAGATAATSRERRDELALDSVLARVGPGEVEQFAQIRDMERDWQRSTGDVASARSYRMATAVLDSTEAFDQLLERRADAQREAIRDLEHANVISAVILAPLALLATALLFWVGQRILYLAREATGGRAALAAVLDEKATLLRGVTHDLKNPLGAVYGYGELLADGVLGELNGEQRDVVLRMQGLVTGALRTVAELLDLYRDERSALAIHRTRADLDGIVRACVDDFAAAAQQGRITLEYERVGHEVVTTTDGVRVRQILGNLVSNAVKYTPPGGVVTVRIALPSADSATYCVSVCDTGPGIPADQRERIFEEYYRLPGTASIPGSGVGLASARRLARLLGGDITVGDAPGGGAEFTLVLPVAS